tara:strand:- start:16203 stop:16328 length:126 start_codon:yes stop_codon:yes gene_type:complete
MPIPLTQLKVTNAVDVHQFKDDLYHLYSRKFFTHQRGVESE